MSFPVSNMWRCDYDCILAYVFRAGLLSNVKFGPDRNEEVIPYIKAKWTTGEKSLKRVYGVVLCFE